MNDLRVKVCLEPKEEDFLTIHHELGHNFYQRAYNTLPPLFRDSANDGFHEAIGDTIALSVTPEYLVKIGLLDKAPPPSSDIGLLLARALEKVAFLPFGLLIDQWRWQVFAGQVTPDHYNEAWWALRLKYQGDRAAVGPRRGVLRSGCEVPRGLEHTVHALFPGDHPAVPVPSRAGATRRAARDRSAAARSTTTRRQAHDWRRCSRWASRGRGPMRSNALTGSSEMDATAMLDYFAPLQKWLDEQIKDAPKGW